MKKYLKRFLSLGAAAVLAAALAGCSDLLSSEESDNSALILAAANSGSSSSDETQAAAGTTAAAGTSAASASVSYGKATASLFVPDYAALAGKAKASSSARAVAPQTTKVVLTYGSASTVAGSVTLDDATGTDATNASGVAGTAYTFSFELPVGTYSAGDIVISLYDDDDTLLSSGKNAVETTITEGEDTAESVTLVPNASDSNKSGSLAAEEMKFISTTLTAAKIKAFAVTGDVSLFIFDSTGKLVSSDSPVTASSGYALIPAQSTGGTYYLGIYNATESEISSYEVSDDGVQSLTGSSSWDAVSVDFSSYSTISQIDITLTGVTGTLANYDSSSEDTSWWFTAETYNTETSSDVSATLSWSDEVSGYTASITDSDTISAFATYGLNIKGNVKGAGKITVTVTGASSGTVSITAADSATSVAVGSLLKLTSDVAATWSTEDTSYVALYSDSDGTTEITSGSTYTDVYVKGVAAADSVTITASASGYTAGEISLGVVAVANGTYTFGGNSTDGITISNTDGDTTCAGISVTGSYNDSQHIGVYTEIALKVSGACIVTFQKCAYGSGTLTGTYGSDGTGTTLFTTSAAASKDGETVSFYYDGTEATTIKIAASSYGYTHTTLTVAYTKDTLTNSVASVSVSGDATIVKGNTATYTATPTATYLNTYDTSALTTTWSVTDSEGNAVTDVSISDDGLLTVSSDLSADTTLKVTATIGGVSGTTSVSATTAAATSYESVTWAFNTYNDTLSLASLYTDASLTTAADSSTVKNGAAGYCTDATYKLPIYVDTGTSGKFYIRESDVQVQSGTTFYIPVSSGSTVTLTHNYSATYTLNGTACSGTAVYTATSAGYLAVASTDTSYFYKIELTNTLSASDVLAFDSDGKLTTTQATGSVTSGATTSSD